MPLYHYKCELCPEEFETYHSIKQSLLKECPSCKNQSLGVVLGEISAIINKGEIKTVGQLADLNAKAMGKEQLQRKMEEDGTLQKIKDGEKMSQMRKIANLTPEKKIKYIETGKI